jgi:hypothetical protein
MHGFARKEKPHVQVSTAEPGDGRMRNFRTNGPYAPPAIVFGLTESV